MLNADKMAQLLLESWADAEKEQGDTLEHFQVVDIYVSDIPYISSQIMG